MWWLAQRIWGTDDPDVILAYQTVKQVAIYDRRLGCLVKLVYLLILIRLLVVKILLENAYLELLNIDGFAHVQLQHPVVDGCDSFEFKCVPNFTAISRLPYCSPEKAALEERSGGSLGCLYLNGLAVSAQTSEPGSVVIPTKITDIEQYKQTCTGTNTSVGGCGAFINQPSDVLPSTFVADIESFTLHIDTTFYTRDSSINANTKNYSGYWLLAGEKIPIPGDDTKQQNSNSPLKSARRGKAGDVISVADLLRVTSFNGSFDLDSPRGMDGTLRQRGGVLILSITFGNHEAWDILGRAQTTYAYSATFLPIGEYHKTLSIHSSLTDRATRTLHDAHGLLLRIEIKGQVRALTRNSAQLFLLLLAASIPLFAGARLAADFYLMNVCPQKETYHRLKHQRFYDYNDWTAHALRQRLGLSNRPNQEYPVDRQEKLPLPLLAHNGTLRQWAQDGSLPNWEDARRALLAVCLRFEDRLFRLDSLGVPFRFPVTLNEKDDFADMPGDEANDYIQSREVGSSPEGRILAAFEDTYIRSYPVPESDLDPEFTGKAQSRISSNPEESLQSDTEPLLCCNRSNPSRELDD